MNTKPPALKIFYLSINADIYSSLVNLLLHIDMLGLTEFSEISAVWEELHFSKMVSWPGENLGVGKLLTILSASYFCFCRPATSREVQQSYNKPDIFVGYKVTLGQNSKGQPGNFSFLFKKKPQNNRALIPNLFLMMLGLQYFLSNHAWQVALLWTDAFIIFLQTLNLSSSCIGKIQGNLTACNFSLWCHQNREQ